MATTITAAGRAVTRRGKGITRQSLAVKPDKVFDEAERAGNRAVAAKAALLAWRYRQLDLEEALASEARPGSTDARREKATGRRRPA
ncbi:hypothetical protein AB4144_14465 [Rhizobiaceae sp. 2RAB30]